MGMITKMATKTVVNKTVGAATSAVVGATTQMVTKSLGLDDSLVGKVMTAGVPMMLGAGAKEPSVTEKLFGGSKNKDKKHPKDADEAEKNFFDVFGAAGKAITKQVSEETGATEKQVGGILGMALPDFEDTIAEEDPADADALHGMFKREVEDEKKKSPSFAGMMAKALF
jgi:hypothetical protein